MWGSRFSIGINYFCRCYSFDKIKENTKEKAIEMNIKSKSLKVERKLVQRGSFRRSIYATAKTLRPLVSQKNFHCVSVFSRNIMFPSSLSWECEGKHTGRRSVEAKKREEGEKRMKKRRDMREGWKKRKKRKLYLECTILMAMKFIW